jgi:ABC-type branched-subunit amino acid transport system ATPase component
MATTSPGAPRTGSPSSGLVRTFQIARGFPRLSVIENLLLYGARQPGETLWKSIARPAAVGRREAELRERAAAIVPAPESRARRQ